MNSTVIENRNIRHLPTEAEVPYFKNVYDTKERFCSYWHQIDEVLKIRPDNVLEIGIGNGFVSHYLKCRGIKIASMDITTELAPLVVGAVEKIPFAPESFDVILCCEVLKHLPYSSFVPSVKNLTETARRSLILSSTPHVSTVYRVHLELPRMKKIKTMFHHPFPRPVPHTYDGEHHWEIGKKSYSLKRIMEDFELCGLDIIVTYRVFEFPYHRFFILKK